MRFKSAEECAREIKATWKADADALSPETRLEIRRLMFEERLTVGQTARRLEIDIVLVSQVIVDNIQSIKLLRAEDDWK